MKRFITKQQHNDTCGPVAIINALKWLGYSAVYRDMVEDFRKLGCDEGTSCYDLRRMLNAYGVKYKLHKRSSVKDIERILDRGNAAIVGYDWVHEESRSGHYIFIDFHLEKWFNAYNYKSGFETGMLRKDTLDAYFYATRKYRKDAKNSQKWMPVVWEIIG